MPHPDFLVVDEPAAGIQRLRARFGGHAYDPHRHETYAIGLTEFGIQAFRYRGAEQASTPGRTIVLHPDEVHDGHAVAPAGFVYRMIYIDAGLITDAVGSDSPPFVPDVVTEDPVLAAVVEEAFDGFPGRLGSLERTGVVAAIADALLRRARSAAPRAARFGMAQLARAPARRSTPRPIWPSPLSSSKMPPGSTAMRSLARLAPGSERRRTGISSAVGCRPRRPSSRSGRRWRKPPPQPVSPTRAI